jgi:hypothetical protein
VNEGIRRRIVLLVAALWVLFCAWGVKAQYVEVDVWYDGFWPADVSIVTGQTVVWFGADDDDFDYPFTVTSLSGAWTQGVLSYPGDYFWHQFNVPGSYDYYDSGWYNFGTVHVTANVPPSVTITNPLNHAVFTPPATFTFAADASDTDVDGLWDVEFYVGTNLVDDVYSSPFSTLVTNLAAGSYTLSVIAYDYAYATATNSISITVQSAAPIRLSAPRIVAGKFQFDATGLTAGKTNVLQSSTNLPFPTNWVPILTNVAAGSSASFTNTVSPGRRFYRLVQLP